jgi:hypothetical protein
MKLTIRVGDSLTDLSNYNRIAVEKIGSRLFLVGVRNSGRVLALYVVKPTWGAHSITEAIHATLGSDRRVCVLTDELREINDDDNAKSQLDSYRGDVGRPNTLAAALASGELGFAAPGVIDHDES